MQSFKAKETLNIKRCLNYYYPFLSERQISELINKKDIKVNGKRIKENIKINVNDFVEVYFDFEKYLDKIVNVIYCDDNIVIVNKPQLIETVSDDDCKFTLEKFLNMKYHFVKAVHRLDLNTKGLVIFALNESAENELLQLIKEHKITKVYKAIVYAKYGIKKIKYTDYLAMDKKLQTAKITDKNSGKIAILEIINSIKIVDDIYEIELQLETGRTHQIRAQLSAHNIYVLGDGKYGDKTVNRLYKKDKQMLQAVRLKFNVEKDKLLSYLNGKVFQIIFDFKLN